MDGWVTIGTNLDTKNLEKELRHAQNELKKFDKEAEKLTKQKAKIELDLSEYERQKQLIEETTNDMLKYAQTTQEVNNVLNGENTQIENLNQKYATQFNQLNEINGKIKENEYNQQMVNSRVGELNSKLGRVKGFDTIKNSIDNVGHAVQKVTRKIGTWALAIFGIRGAYMAVRNAINVIANDNAQLKADIDYIKSAMAYALEPVVLAIVNLAKQLMFYVGYIVKALTGKNIFANANKGLNKATGSAKALNKELSKTVASFDEMNTLQDTSNASSGGGGAGTSTPSFNFGDIDKMEIPWIDKLLEHKDEILGLLGGIAGALTAIKLGFKGIEALGIGAIIGGIVYAIEELIAYLKDPTWENFGGIIAGIGIAILGLSVFIGGVPLAITGAVVLIFGIIAKYWDKIKAKLDEAYQWLISKTDWVKEHFGIVGEILYTNFLVIVKNVIKFWDTIFTSVKGILDGIIKFVKGVFTGNWKMAWEGLKDIIVNVLNLMFAKTKLIFSNIIGVIKNTFSKVLDFGRSIGSKFGEVVGGAFKVVFNGIIAYIEKFLNTPIKAINGLIKVINKVPGVSLDKLPTFNLPRLAKGGILNMPGKGVNVGGAIAGEAGKEFYMPLQDEQMLNMVGQAIGKYITVNLTNVTELDGRTIARKVSEVNNNTDFLMNR